MMGRALGTTLTFADVPFDVYYERGCPVAMDLGTMFQYPATLGEKLQRLRDLNPVLQDFDAWLQAHMRSIPTG